MDHKDKEIIALKNEVILTSNRIAEGLYSYRNEENNDG